MPLGPCKECSGYSYEQIAAEFMDLRRACTCYHDELPINMIDKAEGEEDEEGY